MKKLILLLFIGFYGTNSAQIPVTDSAANGTLTSQLTTATTQLTQLYKTYDLIKETAEKVEKVNNAVKSVQNIGKLISMQSEAIKNTKKIMQYSNGRLSSPMIRQLNRSLSTINRSISVIQSTLSNSFFNMNDKERMEIAELEKNKVFIQSVKIKAMLMRFK
ncbi:hypothetical protein V3471_14750 [Flavobacterium oreochromis]|uniref:hypothetical protein n=1 Tax=Flavobacterium oreochromis TaxID=2906078 RepID=UPI00385DF0B3